MRPHEEEDRDSQYYEQQRQQEEHPALDIVIFIHTGRLKRKTQLKLFHIVWKKYNEEPYVSSFHNLNFLKKDANIHKKQKGLHTCLFRFVIIPLATQVWRQINL